MNYYNTFIEVGEDCRAAKASAPAGRGDRKTVAQFQYAMIIGHPYAYTQEDVLFESFAVHKGIPPRERPAERERFFAREQPCLRASALAKRYGWGIHHDADGRVALYAVGSEEYQRLASDPGITHLRAFRSRRGT
jgi:hypothetical protein